MIHKSKTFKELPDPARASALLETIATGTCCPSLSTDLPLVLYGRGALGKMAQEYLKFIGHSPVPSIEYNEEADLDSYVAVCIVTAPYVPIEQTLLKRGFKAVVPFYDLTEQFRHLHPLSNGWFAPYLSNIDKQNIKQVLELWDDDTSRAHHLQFIAWRRLRQEWSFETAPVLTKSQQFFIPEVIEVLHNHEVFVDAGAHHGDIALEFIRITGGKFNLLVAYEPDLDNKRAFSKKIPQNTRIEIIPYALHEMAGVAKFHSGLGLASQISDTGRDYVATYSLDSFHLPATFIKLHLEGAELPALKGAKHTLLKNRPIVAATICHNADGLWETPFWLMTLLEDYKFLFRLHHWCGSGGIIYAIPNERTT